MARHLRILAHLTDGESPYRETLEHNFPKVPNYFPHEDWPYERLAAASPDVFYCAPPCAPWSRSGGRGLKIDTDPRVDKVGHVLEAGLQIQPRIWVMESVPQMYEWTRDFVQLIENAWLEKGYSVTHFFSNYLLHATPQNRPRYHLIAHQVPLDFPAVNPTVVTVRDAIGDFGKPAPEEIINHIDVGRYGWLLPYTPPGGRLRKAYRHLAGMPPGSENRSGSIGGPPFMLARLRWEAPCLTLVSVPRRFHPDGERLLTVRECLAVSGFNDFPEFELVGRTEEEKCRQIPKGVLPPLGEYLGDLAVRSLSSGRRIKKPSVSVVDYRPQADMIMRRIPKPQRFNSEHFGTMPHFKHPDHRPSFGIGDADDYDLDELE